MKAIEKIITIRQKFRRALDEPLRAELYSAERLSEEARILARSQKVRPGVSHPRILERVRGNSRYLNDVYSKINEGLAAGESFPPSEEWLYDNFHFIEEQLHNIPEDLPPKFCTELPALASGPFRNFPRLYEMALQVITHTDSRFNAPLLLQYIHSFQEISPLTTGELWGFAILLRIGLIENLRRLIQTEEKNREARASANRLSEQILNEEVSYSELPPPLKKNQLTRSDRNFAAQFMIRLQEGGPAAAPMLALVMERITEADLPLEELIREMHQDLAAAQISVSNTVLSLRLLAGMDWSEVVEETSLVDARLRRDRSKR